jgi:hypothetical protein
MNTKSNGDDVFYPKRYFMPLTINTLVFHHIFKVGVVVGVSGDIVQVDFLGDLRSIHHDFLLKLPGLK